MKSVMYPLSPPKAKGGLNFILAASKAAIRTELRIYIHILGNGVVAVVLSKAF